MSNKKKLLIAAAAVIILGVIIGFSITASRKDAVEVETGTVEKREELIAKVSATGQIMPKEYVELQAEISGVITSLFVQEGDLVEKDGLLLRIDPMQTQSETRAQEAILGASLSEARSQKAQIAVQEAMVERDIANIHVSEVEVENARQNLVLAKAVFDRKQSLFEQRLLSADAYEAVKNDLVNAESAMATAEARLEQANTALKSSRIVLEQTQAAYESALSRVQQQQALLERSRDLLSKTTIRSPLTGIITQLNVEVGERAVPGTLNNPAATLMTIADLSVIEAEVEVDETDIVDLELGQEAVVNVDALRDTPIEGQVTEIGNSAIQTATQQEAKEFKVVIQLQEPPASLRPGLSCTAEITTAVREDVVSIPIQALTVREFPVDEQGNIIKKDEKEEEIEEEDQTTRQSVETEEFEGVFRIVDGRAQFLPVTTGILGETDIEVLSGIEAGETIVTGSYKTLRTLSDDDPIKIQDPQKE